MHFPSTNKLIPQSWENQPARSVDVCSGEAMASAAAHLIGLLWLWSHSGVNAHALRLTLCIQKPLAVFFSIAASDLPHFHSFHDFGASSAILQRWSPLSILL